VRIRTANNRRRRRERREAAFVVMIGAEMERLAVEFMRTTVEGAIERFMDRVVPEIRAYQLLARTPLEALFVLESNPGDDSRARALFENFREP
jgi:hypothetical protein